MPSFASSFPGDGLSSAGKFASTFLVILPLEEEEVRAGRRPPLILLICLFQCYLHAK